MKFYAKFKETDDEIITFRTAQERDAWVAYQDAFSITHGVTPENSTFERVSLTTKEATYIIKSKGLILYHDKESDGTIREIYVPRSAAAGAYDPNKINNQKGTNDMEANTSNTPRTRKDQQKSQTSAGVRTQSEKSPC